MLDSFRRGQRWLTLIFVSVIGLVFVFFLGVGGSMGPATPTGNAVVQLDDVRLTQRDLAREKANAEAQLRQQLGDAYDQVGAERFLDGQALGRLVNSVVLSTAADDMGLQVTKDEIRRIVQASPAFVDEEGRFSPEAFGRFADYNYGSQRVFIRSFSRELLGQKLVQLLIAQTTLSDAEVDLRTRYELEEVRIALVALDTTTLPAEEALEADAIEAWAVEHDEELRALFAERAPQLAKPESVRAHHILILAPEGAPEEEVALARERIEAIRTRLVEGEVFEELAEELSEDVGTRTQGGDLGEFVDGDNDPAIDTAAFELEPGEISAIVRSAYGFHILRVDEKVPAREASFDTERLALAEELATAARAQEWAIAQSEALALAIESGQTLEEAAAEAGLNVDHPPALKRRPDGFIAGLGAAEDVLAAAFALEPGQSSPDVYDVAGKRVLFQVLEHSTPSSSTIEAERETRRSQLLSEKQNRVVESWLGDYRTQLERSGRLLINAELALGS